MWEAFVVAAVSVSGFGVMAWMNWTVRWTSWLWSLWCCSGRIWNQLKDFLPWLLCCLGRSSLTLKPEILSRKVIFRPWRPPHPSPLSPPSRYTKGHCFAPWFTDFVDKGDIKMYVSTEHIWNHCAYREKSYSERNLSQCHFVHRKSRGIEPGTSR